MLHVRFSPVSVGHRCVMLASMIVAGFGTSSLLAQPPMPPNTSVPSIDPQTALGAVLTQPTVQPVSASSSLMPGSDMGYQMASMQAQLAEQQQQIGSLRMQLNSPLAAKGRNTASGQLFVTYESVLVQPVLSNNTALISERTEDVYSHILFPWRIEHSPRVQFGYEGEDDRLGWRVRYWHFRHNEDLIANDANGLIPTGSDAFVGFLSQDGNATVGADYFEEGSFYSHVRADVVDFELQRNLTGPIDIYAGLRYGRIAQAYRANTDDGNVLSETEFRGLGPTLAARWEHRLKLNKLSVFANVRGSMLFGQKDFRAIDDVSLVEQRLNDIDLRSGNDGANSMVTNAELQLGMRYTPNDSLTLSVAVESQHYNDVGGANPVTVFVGEDGGMASDGPLDDDLGFLGLSVGSEFAF